MVAYAGVGLSNPSVQAKETLADERRKARKIEAYSLEYVEDFLEPRTTQMPVDRLPQ